MVGDFAVFVGLGNNIGRFDRTNGEASLATGVPWVDGFYKHRGARWEAKARGPSWNHSCRGYNRQRRRTFEVHTQPQDREAGRETAGDRAAQI